MDKQSPANSLSPLEIWQKRIRNPAFGTIRELFQQGILDWFQKNGRDLPWRRSRDPYQILVSELMLQQTQVDRVLEYWPRFLQKFPDWRAVANTPEDEIIKAWEGLGYYNRARNLRRTAIEIVEKYGGVFPRDKETVMTLPGIGEYTAGAVLTFALNIRAPIVDTNVIRVLGRVFLESAKDLTDGEKMKIYWLLSETLLPEKKYWEFNQAIMDFGAMQCIVEKPKCATCPFSKFCVWYKQRSLSRYIAPK